MDDGDDAQAVVVQAVEDAIAVEDELAQAVLVDLGHYLSALRKIRELFDGVDGKSGSEHNSR